MDILNLLPLKEDTGLQGKHYHSLSKKAVMPVNPCFLHTAMAGFILYIAVYIIMINKLLSMLKINSGFKSGFKA